jgi:hypothetical protein
MDDKVSKWLIDNWYNVKVPKYQMLANAGMARLINWPDSLAGMKKAKLNKKWSRPVGIAAMQEIRAKGKLFTGAYIINGLSGQDKITTVADQFEALYHKPKLVESSSMQITHQNLQTVQGIGSFMAGQIVADLRHVWPGTWADKDTWAPLGPGSRRGIAWLLGWDGITELPSMRQKDFELLLGALASEFRRCVPEIMKERKLEMHDLQNVLCESDKMARLTHGTGRAKNGYPGV